MTNEIIDTRDFCDKNVIKQLQSIEAVVPWVQSSKKSKTIFINT